MVFLLFFLTLLLLFFLSQVLSRLLSQTLFTLTRHHSLTVSLLSLLFFPGTVLHELSHFFMATILFVPTGTIEFWPEVRGETVKLGSVAVGKSDPIRRFFIGIAPVIGGLICLLSISYYSPQFVLLAPFPYWVTYVILASMIFLISNTMFSSKKDMEGAGELVGALSAVGLVLYVLGLRIPPSIWAFLLDQKMQIAFWQANIFLLVPLGINSLIVLGLYLFLRK